MQAVDSINARILEIQSRITSLAGPSSGTTQTTAASSVAFSAAMAKAVADSAGTTATRPTASTSATAPGYGKSLVNSKGVPLEFLTYGNGKVPDQALSDIAGTNHELWAPAARSFESMRSAAAKDGVTIGITDSYRTYESQVDLVKRKGLYNHGGLAATPGTSNHGWGTALDLKLDSAAQAWIRKHGDEYGFVEDVNREPWHWHYVPTS